MERFRGIGFIEPNRGPRTIHDLIRDDKKVEPDPRRDKPKPLTQTRKPRA